MKNKSERTKRFERQTSIIKENVIPEICNRESSSYVLPVKEEKGPGVARYAEDPRTLRAAGLSGMTTNFKGFTLIELLVVVLIIGILAAVALPQYEKAVEKTRLSEAIMRISSLEKAMDLYVLANGYENVSFFGERAVDSEIDITAGLQQTPGATDLMDSKNFNHQGYCVVNGKRCYWTIYRSSGDYVLWGEREEGGAWTHYCEFDEDVGIAQAICKQLFKQGWLQGDVFF